MESYYGHVVPCRLGAWFANPSLTLRKPRLLPFVVLIVGLVLGGCASSGDASGAYLPPGLEALVQPKATELLTATGMEDLHLDVVTRLAINDIRHPSLQAKADPARDGSDMWCFTTVAWGTRAGSRSKVTVQWFGMKQAGQDWKLIPRHIVAYPALWDEVCDRAERLDR